MVLMLAAQEQRNYYQIRVAFAAAAAAAAAWQAEVAAQLVAENGVRVPLVVLVATALWR